MNWFLTDANLCNTTNLAFQASVCDSITRTSLNNSMNGCFVPFGMDMYLDPRLVFAQRKYDLSGQYNFGGFNFTPNFNVSNPFLGNAWGNFDVFNLMGWTPSANTNSGSEAKTEAELEAETKYGKLKDLLSKYAKELKTNDDDKSKTLAKRIENAINKSTKKNIIEKYDELKGIYDTINSDDLNKFIFTSNITVKVDKKDQEIGALLNAAGFEKKEFSDKHRDTVVQLHDELKDMANNNATITSLGSITKDNVLSILSCYNSINTENFVSFYMQKYNKLTDTTAKLDAYTQIKAVASALKIKADELASNDKLDKSITDSLKAKIKEFDGTLKDNKIQSGFAAKFNELYALTRIAAATVVETSINKFYGGIDNNIGNNIVADTKKDLESEKLNVKVTIDPAKKDGDDDKSDKADTDKVQIPFNSEIKVLEDVGISQGEWSSAPNVEAFSTGLKSATAKLRKYQEGSGYTQEQWNAAYNGVISYYTNAYKALATVQWNDNTDESGNHRVEGLAGRSFSYKVGDKTYNESAQSYYKEHGDDDCIDSYDEIYNSDSESGTGLYVGCDYEWGCRNDFYFYVNQNALVEKFREFLALV